MPSTLTVALDQPSADRPDYRHWSRSSIQLRRPGQLAAADEALLAAVGPTRARCFIRWEHLTTASWQPGDPFDFAASPTFSLTTPWLPEWWNSEELVIAQEGLVDCAWATIGGAWIAQQANLDIYEDMQVEAFAFWKEQRPELRHVGMLNEPDIQPNGNFNGTQIYALLKTTLKAVARVNLLGLPGPPIGVYGPEATYSFVEPQAAGPQQSAALCAAIAADAAWWNTSGKPNMAAITLHSFNNNGAPDRLVVNGGPGGFAGMDANADDTSLPTMFDGLPRTITAVSREDNGADGQQGLGDGKGWDEAPSVLMMAKQSAFFATLHEKAAQYVSPGGDRVDDIIMFSRSNYVDYSNSMVRPIPLGSQFQINWVAGARTSVYNLAALEQRIADGTGNGIRHPVTGTGQEWNGQQTTGDGILMTAAAVTQPGAGKVWCLLSRVRNASANTAQNITVRWQGLGGVLDTGQPITVDAWRIDRVDSMLSPATGANGQLDKIINGATLTVPGVGLAQTVVAMADPAVVLIELSGTLAGGIPEGTATLAGGGALAATARVTVAASVALAGVAVVVAAPGSGGSAGAVPVVAAVASAAVNTLTTSITLVKPEAMQPGDLAVLIAATDDADTSANGLPDVLAGWELLRRHGTMNQQTKIAVYWRVAVAGGETDGTDIPASVTINFPAAAGSDRAAGSFLRITGAASAPIDALGTNSGEQFAASVTVTDVTTTAANTLAFVAASFDGGDGAPVAISGTGWPTSATEVVVANPGGANGSTLVWATKAMPAPGATGDVVLTGAVSDGWAGFQFAVAPAPASGGATIFGAAALAGSATMAPASAALTVEGQVAMDAAGTVEGQEQIVAVGAVQLTGVAVLSATDAAGTGSAVPVVAAVASVANSALDTSITLTKPEAFAVGDLAVIIASTDDLDTSGLGLPVELAGWSTMRLSGTAAQATKLGVYWRVAVAGGETDGTDIPAAVTLSFPVEAGADRSAGSWLRITGASPAGPIDIVGANGGTQSAGSVTIPAMATTRANTLAFVAASFDGGDGAPVAISGTGWPTSATEVVVANPGGANGSTLVWATKAMPAPGATGDVVLTGAVSDGWIGWQFAVAPTPGGVEISASATLAGTGTMAPMSARLAAQAQAAMTASAAVAAGAASIVAASVAMTGTLTLAAIPTIDGPQILAVAPAVSLSASNTLELTKPGPFAVGDLAVLVLVSDDASTALAIDTATPPPGFDGVGRVGNIQSDAEVGVFVAVAGLGAEADGTNLPDLVTYTAAVSSRLGGWWLKIRNANGIDAAGAGVAADNVSEIVLPEATTTRTDTLVLAVVSTDGADLLPLAYSGPDWGAGPWPADLTGDSLALGGAGGVGGGWLARSQPAAGPTSALTVTVGDPGNPDGMAGFILAFSAPAQIEASAALTSTAALEVAGTTALVSGSVAMAAAGTVAAAAFAGVPPPAVTGSQAAISVVADTSITLAKPGPFAAGDVALLVVFSDDDEAGFGMATPAGWTLLDAAGTTASDCEVAVFARTAQPGAELDGTDVPDAVTVANVSSVADRFGGYFLRVEGAAALGPVGLRASTGNAATLTVGPVATEVPNALVLLAVATDGGDTLPWTATGDGWPGSWPANLTGDSLALGGAGGVGGGWVTTVASDVGQAPAPTVGLSAADGIAAVQITLLPTVPPATLDGASAMSASGTLTAVGVRAAVGQAALDVALSAVLTSADEQAGAAVAAVTVDIAAAGVVEVIGATNLGFRQDLEAVGNEITVADVDLVAEVSMLVEPGDVVGAVALALTLDAAANAGASVSASAAALSASSALSVTGALVVHAATASLAAGLEMAGTAAVSHASAAPLQVALEVAVSTERQVIGSASGHLSLGVVVLAPAAAGAAASIPLMTVRDLVRVRPSLVQDGYGNMTADGPADRLAFRGWLQQDTRAEGYPDGRRPVRQVWLLITETPDLRPGDRVEWWQHPDGDPIVWEVEGPPEPAYQGARWHHTEATLRLVEG